MPLSRRQKLTIGAVVIGTIAFASIAIGWSFQAAPPMSEIKKQKRKKRTKTKKTKNKQQESPTNNNNLNNNSALNKQNAEEHPQQHGLTLNGPNLDSDSNRLAVRNKLEEMLESDPEAVLDGAWRL